MKSLNPYLSLFIIMLLGVACKGHLSRLFHNDYAHQQYQRKLAKADLLETSLGKAWLTAARHSRQNPVAIELPARYQGSFFPRRIDAIAWQMKLKKGSQLRLDLKWLALDSAELFVDLFYEAEADPVFSLEKNIASATFEVKKEGNYTLRLQPELWASGNYEIGLKLHPVYAIFPVSGKDAAAIQSFWGAPRDGGQRRHEGIDIFAGRGTPVVAPVKSRVASVRNRGLGGKQVWLRDQQRHYSLYFAHLDSQLVKAGQLLQAGDTIGTVGNSGNARYTSPHLHFGVYDRGAFDPLPLVNRSQPAARASDLPLDVPWLRVTAAKANLRPLPNTSLKALASLEQDEVLKIAGASGQWYQVEAFDGRRGYVHHSLLGATTEIPYEKSYAFISPEKSDSLLTKKGEFKQIGRSGSKRVMVDSLGNILFY